MQKTAYGQVEGQLGAAAAVLSNMRGDWRVTPAVGFTREQDLVHRVVGRPGIVLVAEGSPGRTRSLVVNEKKRLARFVGTTPVYDVVVGDGEGQVALRGLEKHFLRLPRNIKPKDVNVLDRKLKAMAPAPAGAQGPDADAGAARPGPLAGRAQRRADDDGAGGAVVQAAAVPVGDDAGTSSSSSAVRSAAGHERRAASPSTRRHPQAEQPHRRASGRAAAARRT